MRRRLVAGIVVAGLLLAAGATAWWAWWSQGAPIRVGLLHSKTGPWAAIEKPMLEAELLAIEEINEEGGLLGRRVEAVVADGRSDPLAFARQAERLIQEENVSVLIGCWRSEARKAVLPIVEEAQHLLIYPPEYEGLEQSPNIVYVGGPANQQVIPAVSWCREVLKARKFFVIGSDSLWARAVGVLIKDELRALRAEPVGELYLRGGMRGRPGAGTEAEGGEEAAGDRGDVNEAVARIARAGPDVVLSTVEGPDSLAFYGRMRHEGLTPEKMPVVSFSLDEDALRRLPISDVVGAYAAWDYFQSLDRPENREFLQSIKARLGHQHAISDNFQIAYQSVWIWAETVEDVETDDVRTVNRNIVRQSLMAPEGIVTIDAETRHAWRPFHVGRVRSDGQFEVVWSVVRSIRPIPFPRTRTRAEWGTVLADLMSRVGREERPGPENP